MPAAPLRSNPLIRKRLIPAVNAVEGRCYGNDRVGDETKPPGQDEIAEGKSTVSVDVDVMIQSPQARKPLDRMCMHA